MIELVGFIAGGRGLYVVYRGVWDGRFASPGFSRVLSSDVRDGESAKLGRLSKRPEMISCHNGLT